MGQTEADGATGIFRNRIAMPLKYLSNFWESLEMALINCKVQLKLKWKNHCGLSANVNGDDDGCSNNIIFTIKDIKLDVITLSAKGNQKQNFLEKDLKDQCKEMNIKQEVKTNYNKRVYFLESQFVEISIFYVLIY